MNQEREQNEQFAQVKEKNVVERIIGVFTSPSETFKSVARKPQWAAPLVLVLIISLALSFFIIPIAMEEAQSDPKAIERMEDARGKMAERGMSEQQIDDAFAQQQKLGRIFGPISGVVMTTVLILAVAGILLLIGNVGLGGQASYSAMVSMYTYSMFIVLLGSIIKLPLIIKQQSVKIFFSLATFLSPETSETFLYRLLNKFAIFELWQLAVVIIGVAVINKFPTRKAAVPIIALWLLYVVVVSTLKLPF